MSSAMWRATEGPRRLRADVLLMFGSRIALGMSTFSISVIAARELGPADRGLMAVALATNTALVQIGHLGLVSANSYFAARNRQLIPRLTANSLWSAAALGAIMVGAAVAVRSLLPVAFAGLGWPELLVALAALPVALAATLLQSILLGARQMLAYNVPQVLLSVTSLFVLAVASIATDLSVADALAIVIAQWVLAAPVYYALLRRRGRPPTRPDLSLAREMIGYSARVYLATVASYLVIRLDLFLVNSLLGSAEAGLYSTAVVLADALSLLPVAVGTNLFARVAGSGGTDETTALAFRLMVVVYGAVCAAAAPLSALAIPLLFGDKFRASVGLFLWLLPGVFSLGLLTVLSYHFSGRGYPVEAAFHWLLALAVNIALNLVFLPRLGTYFASITSSISYTIVLVLHIQLFARRTGYSALRPRVRDFVSVVRDRSV